MPSRPVAPLLSDLGIAKSHSRPHVTNDNRPARPAQTLKLASMPLLGRTSCRPPFRMLHLRPATALAERRASKKK